MAEIPVTVVGAGVVGLAIARELARQGNPVVLLERNPRHGMETSSRNSEVIHAGIYYPHGSLKATLCVEGRTLLYELCSRHGIAHRKITKIVTATTSRELDVLEKLYLHAQGNGVVLHRLTAGGVLSLEPHITSVGGFLSPETGIVSAHELMDFLLHDARDHGALFQPRCEVIGIERRSADYQVTIREGAGVSSFTTERIINAAGLGADTVAGLAGIPVDEAGYRLHYCKGSYFGLPGNLRHVVSRLVYPVPQHESLGVHAVLALDGTVKFGPDAEYLPDRTIDYAVPESKRATFAAAVRRLFPAIRDEDLSPDMSGVRPKLQTRGGPPCDFVIRDEVDRGLPGLINLIGIESPGLTSCLSIARRVRAMLRDA